MNSSGLKTLLLRWHLKISIFRSPSCELNCRVKIVIGTRIRKTHFCPEHITRGKKVPWEEGEEMANCKEKLTLQAFHGQQMKEKFTVAL